MELASTSKLLLGSIDAWLLSQPSLFTRNKTLLPVVLQRQTLADGLARYLNQLGLQRRVKTLTLHELLAKDDDQQAKGNGPANRPMSRKPPRMAPRVGAMSKRNRNCLWHCGRVTKNISRICDFCWADRNRIYRERKAREAQEPKHRTAKQQAHIEKLKRFKDGKISQGIAYSE